jgi:hypothetical protein
MATHRPQPAWQVLKEAERIATHPPAYASELFTPEDLAVTKQFAWMNLGMWYRENHNSGPAACYFLGALAVISSPAIISYHVHLFSQLQCNGF